jgi:hypothetical protein
VKSGASAWSQPRERHFMTLFHCSFFHCLLPLLVEYAENMDRSKVPEDIRMQTLHDKLRCSACGPHHLSIRIAYTAAGGFGYSTSPRSAE